MGEARMYLVKCDVLVGVGVRMLVPGWVRESYGVSRCGAVRSDDCARRMME
jgi:hypothetical protein